MPNIAIRKAKDLQGAARAAVEDLLGRPLREDEEVTVMAKTPGADAESTARRAAVARLEKVMDEAARRAEGIPPDELEALIDEATDYVRRWET